MDASTFTEMPEVPVDRLLDERLAVRRAARGDERVDRGDKCCG